MTSSIDDIVTKKIQWAKDNPSLCFFPYNTLDIRIPPEQKNKDKIRVSCCCNLELPVTVNQLTSDSFESLKQSMDQGILPSDCIKCQIEESTGGVSERIRDILAKDFSELDNFKLTKKSKTFELRVLISNVCNLGCRSCEPFSSSTYAKITANDEVDHLAIDVTDIDLYWTLITNTIKHKINECDFFYIHFMGGEPLLHKGNRKIVNWLINNNFNHRTLVRITTSINIPVDPDFLTKLKTFPCVDFLLSIDSVHENYHYVRWPARFEKTINNLNTTLESTRKSLAHFNYILSPVFSLNNIMYLNDYLDFWYDWQKEQSVSLLFLNTNLLYRTRHLDLQALPLIYRPIIVKIINQALQHPIIEEYKDKMLHLYNFLNSALQELETYKQDDLLWQQYLTHTAEFDVRTNTKFEVYNQRLYDILTVDDKQIFSEKLNSVNKAQKLKLYSFQ